MLLFLLNLYSHRRNESSNLHRNPPDNSLILGSVVITYLGLQEVGGWNELQDTVRAVSPDHFNMWRPMSDPDFHGQAC